MKCPIITFGMLDKRLFIPLIGSIMDFLYQEMLAQTILLSHPIVLSLLSSVSLILSVIPFFISKIRSKSSRIKILHKNSSSTNSFLLEYNDIKKELTRYKYYFIFFVSILDFFQTFITCILYYLYESALGLNFWTLDILFIGILGHFFLSYKLYVHQFITMIIVFIFGIVLDFIVVDISEFFSQKFFILCKFFVELIISGEVIIDNYIMDYLFTSPYKLCFYVGIITFILYSGILLFVSHFSCKQRFCEVTDEKTGLKYFDNYNVFKSKIDMREFIYINVIIIIICFYDISVYLTIKYFQPCHFLLILVIGRLFLYLYNIIEKPDDYKGGVIHIIIYILIFFDILIYNEIIELNFCGLNYNTKKNIKKRALKDSENNEILSQGWTTSLEYEESNLESVVEQNNTIIDGSNIINDNYNNLKSSIRSKSFFLKDEKKEKPFNDN